MAKYDPDLDRLFAALGDPTRRAVLDRLARGPATVSELAAAHDMAMPSFLGHLRKLESANLIRTVKQGRVRHCEAVFDALEPAKGWLERQDAMWRTRLDQFDDYVTRLMKERSDDGP